MAWVQAAETSTYSYGHGMCDAYAIALHRKFGYPIAIIQGVRTDKWGEKDYEPVHAIVLKDPNTGIDIVGERPLKEIIERAGFSHPPEEIQVVRISESEAKETFTMEGVTEEQIAEAARYIEGRQ